MKLKKSSIGKSIIRGSSQIIITSEESEKRLKWLQLNFPQLFEEEIKPTKKRIKNDKTETESIEQHIFDIEREIITRELGDDDTAEETGWQ